MSQESEFATYLLRRAVEVWEKPIDCWFRVSYLSRRQVCLTVKRLARNEMFEYTAVFTQEEMVGMIVNQEVTATVDRKIEQLERNLAERIRRGDPMARMG